MLLTVAHSISFGWKHAIATVAGAVYLVYLGIKQWRGASEPLEVDTSSVSKTDWFVQGLVISFTVTLIWALVAGKASGFLQSQRVFRSLLRAAGGLMIIAGVGLALARRGHWIPKKMEGQKLTEQWIAVSIFFFILIWVYKHRGRNHDKQKKLNQVNALYPSLTTILGTRVDEKINCFCKRFKPPPSGG